MCRMYSPFTFQPGHSKLLNFAFLITCFKLRSLNKCVSPCRLLSASHPSLLAAVVSRKEVVEKAGVGWGVLGRDEHLTGHSEMCI